MQSHSSLSVAGSDGGRPRALQEQLPCLEPCLEGAAPALQSLARSCVESRIFGCLASLAVLGNALLVALEQSRRLEAGDAGLLRYAEIGFRLLYALELLVKLLARQRDAWVLYDCVFVPLGLLALLPLAHRWLTLCVRLLSICRTFKLARGCKELWTLILRGFTLAQALLFGVLLVFILSCMSIEILPLELQKGGLSDSARELVQEHFRSLPVAMLTLVQLLSFDDAAHIYRPLAEEHWAMGLLFAVVALLSGVAVLNLLIAMVVQGAVEAALEHRDARDALQEAQRRRLVQSLHSAFVRADKFNSGAVRRQELGLLSDEDRQQLRGCLGLDLLGVFDCLDVQQKGDLPIDDFVACIEAVTLSNTPLALKRIERMLEALHLRSQEAERRQGELCQKLERLSSRGGSCPEHRSASEEAAATEQCDAALHEGRRSRDECNRTMDSTQASTESCQWTEKLTLKAREGLVEDLEGLLDQCLVSFMQKATVRLEELEAVGDSELDETESKDCGASSGGEQEGQEEQGPPDPGPGPAEAARGEDFALCEEPAAEAAAERTLEAAAAAIAVSCPIPASKKPVLPKRVQPLPF